MSGICQDVSRKNTSGDLLLSSNDSYWTEMRSYTNKMLSQSGGEVTGKAVLKDNRLC